MTDDLRQPLWTAREALAATGGTGPDGWQAHGVSIDSRSLLAGDLFVALAGPSFDGHDFVAKALEKGAAAALVHRLPEGLPAGAPLLLVEDTLDALRALGRAGRDRSSARILAVTGSAGKTGTKDALRACLSTRGLAYANAASFNNHWGVPLSLARLPREAAFGIFELGMNHAGEIAALTRLVRPEIAVITNIGLAHIEYLGSQEAIADAKAEIFLGMPASGAAVLPRDDAQYERLQSHARKAGIGRVVGFGRHPQAEIRLVSADLYATCSAVSAVVFGEPIEFCLSLPGEHHVFNALAVLGAARLAGADLGEAAAELARLKPLKGRGARRKLELPGGPCLLIDESYNANPKSVEAALSVLAKAALGPGGRRVAVLGDMLELGAAAADYHRALARPLEVYGIDRLYCCGPMMGELAKILPAGRLGAHEPDSRALAARVVAELRPGDAVLVKGSLGSRMAAVIEALDALEGRDDDDQVPPRAANGN
ncbi:UDP-N-acetylmuramoyl-tripeptide--D-alanyl-D-alanine ligase [Tistlia consotensis]|uniref:UDP-N-acetylmuramoyl-tripeptide--D-alanyl-D-alanine ligase n=1 Tax=Tistlia consotensis USBA 355 TaxID=560819 RepID=A0A1Y6CRK4_9PROT|nr:UDP-N-acetylmuramoylalanyl-D-glutamyl-2,6-diaminopimelate--D-alanyl-D-alanine ligase [Tistlia consotensis]SMF71006.1 UDP-N-acetylmuramoyl-tripeptide--D-alanyl-D-alanine ligase [Tistlia consotensis USBA 355]SNS07054.1 UDP-N-acetylmuramoyl-tripeptide--D-alanyl-D-alanine ligase [Tistlia consotensis]